MPPDVKKLMAELLLACKSYSLPDAQDDALVVEACPQTTYVEPAASKADPLDSCMINRAVRPKKIFKMVKFGGAEIHELIPLQGPLGVDEKDNAVRALHKDIGDLQVQVQRMTESHQSEVSGLQGKLKHIGEMMADAQNQIESNRNQIDSNARSVLAALTSSFASLRH